MGQVGEPDVTREDVESLIVEQRRRVLEMIYTGYQLARASHPLWAATLYDRVCFLEDDVALRADRILAGMARLEPEELCHLLRWQFGPDLLDLDLFGMPLRPR